MDQLLGNFRTVAKIELINLIECSEDSYEIHADITAIDFCGSPFELESYDFVVSLERAWEKIRSLHPGSIHYAEGGLRIVDGSFDLMSSKFTPYSGDIDEGTSFFKGETLRPNVQKIVSGSIGSIRFSKKTAIIGLAQRVDYGLIILPDLYDANMELILSGDYLEYTGVPHWCSMKEDNVSRSMIFVSQIQKLKEYF